MRKQEHFKNRVAHDRHRIITLVMYALTFLNTLVGTIFILDSEWLRNATHMKDFISVHTGPFVLSFLIVGLVNLVLIMLFGNIIFAQMIFLTIVAIITFSNQQKIIARNEPIMPQELGLAKNAAGLLDMVDKTDLIKTIIIAIVVLGIGLFATYYFRKHYQFRLGNLDYFTKKTYYITRISILVVALSSILIMTNISNKESNIFKATTTIFHTNFEGTTTQEKIDNNGYLLTFVYNMKEKSFDHFDKTNYTEKEMNRVIQTYTEKAAQMNETRENNQPNVVYILSESFIDPLKRSDVYPINRDPIPYIRQLMDEETAGEALVGEYGGGTANMEFELLTSFSMSFLDTIPYQQILPFKESFPSVASFLQHQNYETVGVHPFFGHFYERETNYPKLGFQKFIDEDHVKYPGKAVNPYYVSDDALLTQVVEDIAEAEQPTFTMAITMQNHQPYNEHIYDAFIGPYDIDPTIPMTDEKREQMETYLKGLEISNNAFEGFIQGLNNLEEDTVVVFFGDHYPGHDVYGDVYDNQLIDYQTPLLIYATNERTKNIQLGTTSLNFVTPQVLEMMGMRTSPFYALVSELNEEVQSLTKKFQLDAAGRKIKLADLEKLPAYQDYELIQYDSIKGNGYAQTHQFFNIPD